MNTACQEKTRCTSGINSGNALKLRVSRFVTTLRTKAKSCHFGDQEESLIRDRIVIGCPDSRLQERLLREIDLDLQKTLTLCRAAESTKVQVRLINGEAVDAVTPFAYNYNNPKPANASLRASLEGQRCSNCGGTHKPRNCPAYGKFCHNCNKLNHFSKCCRSVKSNIQHVRSTVRTGTQSTSNIAEVGEAADFYVGTVQKQQTGNLSDSCWWEVIRINDTPINCKLDSGAEVNVMSFKTYKTLHHRPPLENTTIKLKGYATQAIKTLGKIQTQVDSKHASITTDFYVAEDSATTLLGLPTCQSLNLMKRVCEVSDRNPMSDSLLCEYADVFSGLGEIPGEHHIRIDDSISPVVHAPRRVPIALEAKLKQTLQQMERQGVIIKRDDPTDWVNSLLVVEKRDGSLRLCLDPRDLNRAIKREHYRIPTCDDVFSKLSGKNVFTIIDMKSGFWQIKLDDYSSRLCTFNTPFGRY